MENREKDLLKSLGEATKKAAEQTLSQGRPITFALGHNVVREFPDGSKEIVKQLNNPPVKVKRRIFKLRGCQMG